MKIRFILFIIFFCILILLFSCNIVNLEVKLYQGDKLNLKRNLDKIYNDFYNKFKEGSFTFSLVDENGILYSESFGYKDYEKKIKADNTTGYRIGSISKLFTAIAIMQLQERGLLNIDDPIKKYIPEFSIKSRYKDDSDITIKSIMTHHSGLPSDYYFGFVKSKDDDEKFNLSILFDLIKSEYKTYPTNFIFSYSNLAISILGEIIKRVSKIEFNQYMEENIFKPLNMKNTSFYLDNKTKNILADGISKGKLVPYYTIRDIPAGNLISTSSDMANFMIMLLNKGKYINNVILPEKYFNSMIIKQNENIKLDGDVNIGLNFFLNNFSFINYDFNNYGHEGYIPPFYSRVVIFKDKRIGLFYSFSDDIYSDQNNVNYFNKIINNTVEVAFQYKGDNLENIKKVYEKRFNKTFYPFNYFYVSKNIERIKEKDIKEKGDILDKLSGNYFTLIGKMKIYLKNKKLFMEFQNNLFHLYPVTFKDGDKKLYENLNLEEGILLKADVVIGGIFYISGNKAGVPLFKIFVKDGVKYLSICSIVDDKLYCDTAVGREFEKKEIPNFVKNYLGLYDPVVSNENMKTFFSEDKNVKNILVIEDGYLLFKFNFMGQKFNFYLYPVSENEFIVMGAGRMSMDTLFLYEKDGKKLLRWSGLEFIKK